MAFANVSFSYSGKKEATVFVRLSHPRAFFFVRPCSGFFGGLLPRVFFQLHPEKVVFSMGKSTELWPVEDLRWSSGCVGRDSAPKIRALSLSFESTLLQSEAFFRRPKGGCGKCMATRSLAYRVS